MTLVVDASVAAKWFLAEEGAERAVDLLQGAPLHAPSQILVEVASAITRRFRTGGLSADDALKKAGEARDLLQWPLLDIADNAALLERACEIAVSLRHPLADCIYVALAEREDVEFLTVDPTLLKRAVPHFSFVRAFL